MRGLSGCKILGLAAGALLALSTACQTVSPPPSARHDNRAPSGSSPVAVNGSGGEPLTADQAVADDPCAMRLHDIAGAIAEYYALYKTLPQRLADVATMADLDGPLNFTCPLSGQPYVYVPQGLRAPGRTKLIIVHDAAPSHDGKRWCIVMTPLRPGAAVSLDVVPLPEPIFRAYQPDDAGSSAPR